MKLIDDDCSLKASPLDSGGFNRLAGAYRRIMH